MELGNVAQANNAASEWLLANAPANVLLYVERLEDACETLKRTWKRAGPTGSGQLEKFDTAVWKAEIATDMG